MRITLVGMGSGAPGGLTVRGLAILQGAGLIIGARRLLPDVRSVVSVDYGTATNFDCVTGNAYLGGLICPGVMSSLGALATRTAQLPRIALTAHADVPIVGRSTVTSLNHGFLFGFASMTEGLYARLTKTLEGPIAFVATGGFAPDGRAILVFALLCF